MFGNKLCLGLSKSFGLSYEEQIRLFKKTGFEGFFADWSAENELESIMKHSKKQLKQVRPITGAPQGTNYG